MEVTVTGERCASAVVQAVPGLAGVDVRLSRRYVELCWSHLSAADRLAAGLHTGATPSTSLAATQAAWRFLNNEAVTLPVLAGPLQECAAAGRARRVRRVGADGLVQPALQHPPVQGPPHGAVAAPRPGVRAADRLGVSDRDGSPLAPLCLELGAGDGVHSTRSERPLAAVSVLDGLLPVMNHVRDGLGDGLGDGPGGAGLRMVFIIDAEADSVGHYRAWSDAGHKFLARADPQPRVLYDAPPSAPGVPPAGERQVPLGEVADLLKAAGAFELAREVDYKGVVVQQFVAEAAVVLTRPARTHRVDKATGKPVHKNVPGAPLALRRVVTELRDGAGRVLARWLLLTDLPASVPAATVALWYYWRWRIETYHDSTELVEVKLLKGAGQHVEQWQQETPAALARRLAVAAMAAVVVWRLARDPSPQAAEMRDVLVKLSGRQIKRGQGRPAFTEPALLDGLGVLIPVLLLLEQYDLDDLRALTERLLPGTLPTTTPSRRRKETKVE